MKQLLLLSLLAVAGIAQAETSAAKQALINKILKAQQPALEAISRGMVEQPAIQMSQQAALALQSRVAADKREAAAKEIQTDLKKYLDETVPIVRDRAIKLAPTTIGKLLDEKFTEKELKELVALLESPVNRKFLELGPAMQRALGEPLVAETRPLVEPKVRALEQSIAGRLGVSRPAAPGVPGAPAAPATKPAGN